MGSATMVQAPASRQSLSSIRQPMTRGNVSEISRNGSTSSAKPTNGTTPNKEKEFPALAVAPKTAKSSAAFEGTRKELDNKIKEKLLLAPAKFTEWLIQEGLVLSEQNEIVGGKKKSKLKLGMYSDSKKFPNSGGYVWINEANPSKFVSVFRGSIFEATSQAPTVVLKLLYHWSCQTSISNILQWVKVENPLVNQFWELFRAVCTATVQDELVNLGGKGKVAEIGVISLGTTSSDGKNREVRVEVLGMLDRATGTVRLRATEPIKGASQNERFAKIFEPLPVWVDMNTRIMTDLSIDKDRLSRLGYANVTQCNPQAKSVSQTNQQVMEYLKRVVPKMFQNNLSLLKTNVIQQFLDELTFRESFGHYPLKCFEEIVKRVSNQTTVASNKNTFMAQRIKAVAEKPFNDWRTNPVPPPRPSLAAQANKASNFLQNRQQNNQSPKARLSPNKYNQGRPNQQNQARPGQGRQLPQAQGRNAQPLRPSNLKSNLSNLLRNQVNIPPHLRPQLGNKRPADSELSRPDPGEKEGFDSQVTTDGRTLPSKDGVSLYMQCNEEPLSSAQRSVQNKRIKEFKEQMLKLEDIAKEAAKFKEGELDLNDDETTSKSDEGKDSKAVKDSSPVKRNVKSRQQSEESNREDDNKEEEAAPSEAPTDDMMAMDLPLF